VNCWRIFYFSRCASSELCNSHAFKYLGQAQTVRALVCRFEQLGCNLEGSQKSVLTNHGLQKKKYTGLQPAMKLSLAANLVLNWVCPVLSFPQRFQPITAAAMCTVAINVLEPRAFNAESQYFIPLLNKISWLGGQQSGGDEASNGGCKSGPTGHDFPHNSNIYFLFFTMRTGPFSKCENQSSSQIECQVRTFIPVLIAVLIFGEPDWKLAPVFSRWVRTAQHWIASCTTGGWWLMSYWEYHWGTSLGTYGEHDGNTRKKIPSSPLPPPPPKKENEHTLGCMFSSFMGYTHILFQDMVATICHS
jgi:hypothetical protein